MAKYRYPLALVLLASIPFLSLLHGQFLYDDVSVVWLNQNLARVHTFLDCFSFVLKPSKPVTSFFIALGQWWGGGGILAHRLISLAVHVSTTLLFFANVNLLIRRLRLVVPPALPFWICAIFALHPLHSEPMAVILFRMEMLGTMFSLLALWSFQRLLVETGENRNKYPAIFLWTLLFFAMGLAQLSKEVFAATLPLTLVAFFLAAPRSAPWRRFLPAIFAMELVWALVLVVLLRRDPLSEYPYRDVIGYAVQSPLTQIRFGARALLEGAVKAASGHGLSIFPVRERQGLGAGMGLGMSLAVLASGLGLIGLLWRAGGWWRAWGSVAGFGIFVYLLIPNINIGSEHYWYFPLVGWVSLGGFALWRAFERRVRAPRLWMWLTVTAYAAALSLGLQARLRVLHSRIELYLSETVNHPESAAAWSAVVTTILERPGLASAQLAEPFLQEAKRLAPYDPNVLTAEFTYQLSRKSDEDAKSVLRTMEFLFPGKPKSFAEYEFHLGLLEEGLGHCTDATQAYVHAEELDPARAEFRGAAERARRLRCEALKN